MWNENDHWSDYLGNYAKAQDLVWQAVRPDGGDYYEGQQLPASACEEDVLERIVKPFYADMVAHDPDEYEDITPEDMECIAHSLWEDGTEDITLYLVEHNGA